MNSVSRSFLALVLLAGGGWLAEIANAASVSGASPDGLWQLQADAPAARPDRSPLIQAARFQTFTADLTRLRSTLASAPLDKATADARGAKRSGAAVEISLPLPEKGGFARFKVEEVGIMAPALAALYPQVKTYRGVGIDDPTLTLALDVTPYGLHAQIMSPKGWVYINPFYLGGADDLYASYLKQDEVRGAAYPWDCYVPGAPTKSGGALTHRQGETELSFGGSLRTYRLACAANGEYVATTGGTVASGQAAVVTVINRVSAIYESELGIRLVLVANNNLVIYPNAANDPYSNGTGDLNVNTGNLNTVIGAANYDIGHVFTTGSGGVAQLGCVCGANKGAGTTGLPTPVGDAFNVDFVAHEMGHQFGGNHTFNGNTGNCGGGNRSAMHAYEVGSGSTIMAYAGICGATSDLQPNSDAYFNYESISEILTFAAGTGGACPVATGNGNSAPVVNAGADYTIPRLTPFMLTGAAMDADGDILTYCWEEHDRGVAQAGTAADNGTGPLFRSFTPVYGPSRTFPKVSSLLNNTTTIGEQLPNLPRTMSFFLSVRDNRTSGGGIATDDIAVTVAATAGPFLVTSPNTAITATASTPLSISWDVANTNVAPVNTSAVNILLSLDGGYTYPITLAANTANDGAETVMLPAGARTTTARIKVTAVNNVYFDISNVNFTIN